MVKKALYIGLELSGIPKTGGEYVQLQNRKILKEIIDYVDIFEIPKIGISLHAINVLRGKSYGYTKKLKNKLDTYLKNEYGIVFIESTVYGGLVKYVRDRGFKTIVFCHNVEYEYYKAKYESKKTMMNKILVSYIKRQERLSLESATGVIALNFRDSDGIEKLYNRSADVILPIFYEQIKLEKLLPKATSESYLLFVGANFFANTDGICWFIENVSNYINRKLYVAGGCCSTIVKTLDMSKYHNVKLLGYVDDLDAAYINASGVVCPIFAGSGMKTKTIEALKYGKTIFGTIEAFEGISIDYEKVGGLCNTAKEFINSINNRESSVFNEYSYDFFVNNLSKEAIFPKFQEFINRVYVMN